jgi:leader peptidase (prepilin peptidase)/N-methyltransferase
MPIFDPVAVIIFVCGAAIGSFLNVCILRIPKSESLVHPASHCPACRSPIGFYDNVPLLSYVFLGGRCRSCKVRISPRYFIVELLTAVLGVLLYHRFGLTLAFFSGFVFVSALIVISFIDLDVRLVPDLISLPGIAVGLLISVVGRYAIKDSLEIVPSPFSAVLGVVIGGGFLLLVAWAYEYFTGIEGMGGGDIKLLAMIGAFLGWTSIPVTLFAASLAGSVVGLVCMLAKGVGRRFALPFAPFLCFGALVYLFFSHELVSLYFPSN